MLVTRFSRSDGRGKDRVKIHYHTNFGIPTSKNIGDMLQI